MRCGDQAKALDDLDPALEHRRELLADRGQAHPPDEPWRAPIQQRAQLRGGPTAAGDERRGDDQAERDQRQPRQRRDQRLAEAHDGYGQTGKFNACPGQHSEQLGERPHTEEYDDAEADGGDDERVRQSPEKPPPELHRALAGLCEAGERLRKLATLLGGSDACDFRLREPVGQGVETFAERLAAGDPGADADERAVLFRRTALVVTILKRAEGFRER